MPERERGGGHLAGYTQTVWGENAPTNLVREPAVTTEAIIEGIFLAHNKDTTKQLRTRLERRGVSSLSDTELVSLVLRTNSGNEHIEPRIHNLLSNYSVQELLHMDFGILRDQYRLGAAKAAQLQAMLEVARRLLIPSDEKTYAIVSPSDAAALVRPEMEYLDHEEMRVLLLDTKNHVTGNLKLYQGTVDSAVLRTAEIFRPAVARQSPNVIVCHNHPGGDPTPSQQDIDVTKQLVGAGKLLEIDLLDHIIIGHNGSFTSLREKMTW